MRAITRLALLLPRRLGTLPHVRALALLCAMAAAGCATGDDGVNPRGGDGGSRDASASDAGRDSGAPPECEDGERVPCATTCGSTGSALCTAGRVGACASPPEECDGVDQDCDGVVDESVEDRACSTECGGGVSRCLGGRFTECTGGTPRPETCDGTDEDCDALIDEGLTRACSTACGAGVETCSAGVFGGCTAPTPRAETCDGTDEDCDGVIDDGLTRACSTACGSGTETCSAGAWVSCTAPPVVTETCNLIDDDCDGAVDEGFHATIFDPVPMSELTAAQPPCDGPTARIDVCMSAARRWCLARPSGCYTAGGAGHLQATATGARVVCFGSRGDEHNAAFTAVSSASGITITDVNVSTRVAQSAVNRYCRSRGSEAGVGPTEHSSGTMTVTCLPSDVALTVSIPATDLTSRGCNPVLDPNTLACSAASDATCRARGHLSGYGPVEWNTTDAAVVCFRAP